MALLKAREEELRQLVREGLAIALLNHWNTDQVSSIIKKAQKAAGKQLSKEEVDYIEKVAIPEISSAATSTNGNIGGNNVSVVITPEGGVVDSQKVGGEQIASVPVGGEEPPKAVEPEVVEEVSWKDLYSLDKDTGEFKINLSKVVGGAITLLNDKNSLKRAAAAGSSKALKVGIHKALRSEFKEEQVVEKRPQHADAIERGVCNIVDSFLSQLFG